VQSQFPRALEILLVIVLLFAIDHFASNPDFALKGVELAATTAIIFGYSIYRTRGVQRPARFWWTWSVFLFLHLAIYSRLFLNTPGWHRGQRVYVFLAGALLFAVLSTTLPARGISKKPN
jgi:hypothetical protein